MNFLFVVRVFIRYLVSPLDFPVIFIFNLTDFYFYVVFETLYVGFVMTPPLNIVILRT